MSKFEDIIARVDEIKPNAFSAETKLSWLTSLNGKLAIDIFMMDIAEVRELPQGAAAIDCEPLVGFPHEEVYEEYLAAKIDAENGEASEYQNRMQIYDAYYTNFVGWFKATYDPVQGDPNCHGLKPKLPTYYITAYGLARMKGFTGTIEEWLASLKGDPGVSVTVTTVPIEGGHRVTFVDVAGEKSFDVMDGAGNVSSVCGMLPDQTGNVPLTAEKVGARPDNWTPTAEDVGARPDNWTPTAADVGARPDNWTPSADDVKALPTAGGSMTGPINMNGQAIKGLNAPTADDQAVNKEYVDTAVNKAAPRDLLINSYFANPVNQRGQAIYTEAGYTIDGWRIDIGGITVSIEDGSVSLMSSGAYNFSQTVGDYKSLRGKTATFALKYSGDVTIAIGYYANGENKYQFAQYYNGIAICSAVIPDNVQSITVFIQTKPEIKANLYWADLYEGEYTPDTLPEYQPKEYAVEFMECQRFYVDDIAVIGSVVGGTTFEETIILPLSMRVNPTVTITSEDGTTGCASYWTYAQNYWTDIEASVEVMNDRCIRVSVAGLTENAQVKFHLNANAEL